MCYIVNVHETCTPEHTTDRRAHNEHLQDYFYPRKRDPGHRPLQRRHERQARKDFSECYRHGTGTIISIELVSTNAPATKQQERDTLEKIRKMVEQLGPDSYLATAFEGCFDLAAENIDNDWACSMADRARRAEKRAAELEDKLAESVKDYEAAHAVAEEKDAEIAQLKAQLAQMQETARWNGQRCDEEATAAGEAQRRAEAAEAEVIQLKAKLYDLLVAGK